MIISWFFNYRTNVLSPGFICRWGRPCATCKPPVICPTDVEKDNECYKLQAVNVSCEKKGWGPCEETYDGDEWDSDDSDEYWGQLADL